MNRSPGLTAFAIMLACTLGCGKFGAASNTTGAANTANTAPAKVEKAVDLPALLGKSVDEIKKTLGPPTSEISFSTWKFPQGELSVDAVQKDKNKVSQFIFTAAHISVGGQTAQGFATHEKLGDLIGLDTRSLTPKTPGIGDDKEDVIYEKVPINGHTVEKIHFDKTLDSFRSVTVRMVPH